MISVIIPVYNAEQYLKRCIDSVISQTYSDIELVIVDDGSTDNSGEICRTYSKQDSRVRYIYKENSGPGETRIYGIRESKGDYVFFLDSDDYLVEDAIEKMLGAISDDVDCVIAQHHRFSSDGSSVKQVSFPVGLYDYQGSNRKTYIESMQEWRFGSELWNKLVRRGCLKTLLESDIKVKFGEDFISLALILKNCRKVICISDTTYFYEYKDNSLARNSMKWMILPEYAKQCVDLEDVFVKSDIDRIIYPLFVFWSLIPALARYSSDKTNRKLIEDLWEVCENQLVIDISASFLKNKRYYKDNFGIRKNLMVYAECFYKAINKKEPWYVLSLYPAKIEKHSSKYVIRAYIKKAIHLGGGKRG